MKTLLLLLTLSLCLSARAEPVGYADIIKHRYPAAIPLQDFRVADRGGAITIAAWNIPKLGAQPTLAELDSFRAAAQAASDARDAQEATNATDREQLKALVAALRNGTGTQVERIARVERACARLIEDTYR